MLFPFADVLDDLVRLPCEVQERLSHIRRVELVLVLQLDNRGGRYLCPARSDEDVAPIVESVNRCAPVRSHEAAVPRHAEERQLVPRFFLKDFDLAGPPVHEAEQQLHTARRHFSCACWHPVDAELGGFHSGDYLEPVFVFL